MKRAWMLTTAALVAVACGDGSVFSENAPDSPSGTGGNGGTSSNSSAESATATSSVQSSASSGSVSSSGAGGDTGPGPASSSSSGVGGNGGSGGDPPPGTLDCGNEVCPLQANSACCYDAYDVYGPPQATCVTGPVTNDGCQSPHDNSGIETVIQCQTPSQCGPGLTCCADRETVMFGNQQVTLYVETSCQANCDFPDIQLCNDLNSSASCPFLPQGGGSVQGVCQQSQLLPQGYYVCGYP